MNKCRVCNKTFKYTTQARNEGYRKTLCPSCSVSITRHRNRQKALDHRGGKCIICGYNKYSGALHLHHLNPETKEFTVNLKGCSRSIKRVLEESEKCVVLCAVCHAEVHAGVAHC